MFKKPLGNMPQCITALITKVTGIGGATDAH